MLYTSFLVLTVNLRTYLLKVRRSDLLRGVKAGSEEMQFSRKRVVEVSNEVMYDVGE